MTAEQQQARITEIVKSMGSEGGEDTAVLARDDIQALRYASDTPVSSP